MYTLSMGKMYTLSTEKSITSLYTLSGEINNILVYLIYMGESVPTYVYLIYKEINANLCILYSRGNQYQSMYILSMWKSIPIYVYFIYTVKSIPIHVYLIYGEISILLNIFRRV